MIEVRLELTEETTIKDLVQFAEMAWKHGHERTKVVQFRTPDKGETETLLAFKPITDSKKTMFTGQTSYRGDSATHIGGRPIDTL